jgi:hypothetical protein
MIRRLALGLVAVAAAGGCGGGDRVPEERAPRPAPEGAAGPLPAGVWFEDVTRRSGVDFVHHSGRREKPLFPEIMGGGCAVFDMDGDADLDLYLVQSGSLHEPGGEDARNRLYENRGDGTFEDVTDRSGADDRGYGMGVAAGDYDADGDTDLYVTNVGPNVLLRNDGDGHFADVTAAAGVGEAAWSTSAAFADLDADGDLDLFVTNYVAWAKENEMECLNAFGVPDYCLPLAYEAPTRDTLYRNDGDGAFADISVAAGIGAVTAYGLGVACADFDGDGRIDVFIANDSVFNQLWMNRGGLVFEDEALFRGCAVDEDGVAKAGMGVQAVDYDDDGDQDVIVANLERQSDSFYANEGGVFHDRTALVGLGVVSRAFTRFGLGFQDFDQDGWLDLYIATGRVTLPPEPASGDPYAEPDLLFRGAKGGMMTEVLPRGGTAEPAVLTGRGAAFGDLDGDGAVDVVVANRDGPVQILRNVVAARGRRVTLRVLERTGADALGARVTARLGERTITRIVQSGYSYQAASDPAVHIGTGDAEGVDAVSVTWVDGEETPFGPLGAGETHVLRRGGR